MVIPLDVYMSGDPLNCTGFLPGNYGEQKLVDVLDLIGSLIEETVDLAKQIILEVDSDDIQGMLASHNQDLVEMHEQEQQDIEELES
ncbi:hypothetical protein TNCV_3033061 [Trichonephila clavipes]|nr:hypothetical protein TNCV_3033061 [Trichonephila clavipes]